MDACMILFYCPADHCENIFTCIIWSGVLKSNYQFWSLSCIKSISILNRDEGLKDSKVISPTMVKQETSKVYYTCIQLAFETAAVKSKNTFSFYPSIPQ